MQIVHKVHTENFQKLKT